MEKGRVIKEMVRSRISCPGRLYVIIGIIPFKDPVLEVVAGP